MQLQEIKPLRESEEAPLGKAGLIPYIIVDGEPEFLTMTSSDATYGGDKPMLSKGGIDPGETPEQAAIREAEEELGLRRSNLAGPVKLALSDTIRGMQGEYQMDIFYAPVRSKTDFDKPHYETLHTTWMTLEDLRREGRGSHLRFFKAAYDRIK